LHIDTSADSVVVALQDGQIRSVVYTKNRPPDVPKDKVIPLKVKLSDSDA